MPNTFASLRRLRVAAMFSIAVIAFIVSRPAMAAPQDLGLTTEEKAWIAAHPVIRVHNESNRPPVNFVLDGKPMGYSIDYINMLASRVGLQVEYVAGTNWESFLEMARKGELDVMLNIKETPDRAKFLNFTQSYLTQVSTIVSTKSNTFATLDSLKGKRVATVKGYFYESWIKKQSDITLLYCEYPKHCLEMVAFGQADASFNSLGQADYLIRNEGFGNLHYVAAIHEDGFKSTLAMASRKDLPILRDILSKAISKVTPEEDSALQRKWLLGKTALPVQARLSPAQRDYLKGKQEIRMCSAPATPPLAETLADGTHRGIVPELMAKFSAALNVPVVLVPTRTWAESIQFAKERRCDILAFAQETPERRSFLDFTRPYASFPYVIVTRNTETYITDLAAHPGAKLGVTKEHAITSTLKAKYPAAMIVEVRDTLEGLQKVQDGHLFALINSLPIVGYAIQSHGFVDLKVSGQLDEKQDIAVAVRNDEPMLLEVFQAAINSVPQEDLQQIINRWLSVRIDKSIDYSMAWKVLLIGVFIVLGVLYWNWKLRMLNLSLSAARHAAENVSLAKSRFLAAASHDLRQPMQAIGLFQDTLSRTNLSAEQKKISDYLALSVKSLGDILDALLDISKLDAGVVTSCPKPVQANALFRAIDAEFAPLTAAKSLRFKLHFPQREIALFTDPKLLQSLLGNLIGNAIKYTDKGGVLVAIRRRSNQALIQVWDTGIGIDEEHLCTIYEEFFQVGNAERDRSKGLGLGLAIARRLANLLETEIRCHSRPGKGSVFEFCLHLATSGENTPSSQRDPPKVAPSAKPAGCHVVLVDDDLIVGAATKLALESRGMTVACYKTAEEALADPEIAEADFYISDLRLPGKDGIEFLNAVQQRAMKQIKAVVLTGDTAVNRIEMMQSTQWQVLFKPVDLASLLAAIEARDSGQ